MPIEFLRAMRSDREQSTKIQHYLYVDLFISDRQIVFACSVSGTQPNPASPRDVERGDSDIARIVDAGELKPVLDEVEFGVEQVGEAHARLVVPG